jgi:aryl-alcohol dehydrogenase-like predicted oxidoreductase
LSRMDKLGLGSVQFGMDYGISNQHGKTGHLEVANIIEYATSIGIDTIDTAYGYGDSEKVLGQVGVDTFKVISKVLLGKSGLSISEQVSRSLVRLNLNRLYGLLLHRPLDALENPEVWKTIKGLKRDGIVEKIGFSLNTVHEVELVLEKGFIPDLIQAPYNYLDKRFVPYMRKWKEQGCEIHSRSSFLQGILLMSPDNLPSFFDDIKPVLHDLQQYGVGKVSMLLEHCLNQHFIDRVIIGVNNRKQLESNVRSLGMNQSLAESTLDIKEEILTPSTWPPKHG